MKKIILRLILIFLILIMMLEINTFAAFTPGDINGDVTISNEDTLTDFTNKILGFIDMAGTVLAIVIITIIGIQYMKGSFEQKAQYKEKLMPYAVGCVILVAAPKLVRIIYKIASNIS